MYPLVLQTVEEAFRRRVVSTISLAAYCAALAIFRQPSLKVVTGPDVVLAHEPLNLRLAGRKVARADLRRHTWRAIDALDFGMDCPDKHQQLPFAQTPTLGRAAAPPCAIAVPDDRQDLPPRRQRTALALRIDPKIFQRRSFAKNTVAHFLRFQVPFSPACSQPSGVRVPSVQASSSSPRRRTALPLPTP